MDPALQHTIDYLHREKSAERWPGPFARAKRGKSVKCLAKRGKGLAWLTNEATHVKPFPFADQSRAFGGELYRSAPRIAWLSSIPFSASIDSKRNMALAMLSRLPSRDGGFSPTGELNRKSPGMVKRRRIIQR